MPEEKQIDPANMTEEERLAELNKLENPSSEEEPAQAATSEPEDKKIKEEEKSETEKEAATSEVASEEEQPTEEPAEEEAKLYAGKYRTVDDLEAAYSNQRKEAEKVAHERSELEQKLAKVTPEKAPESLPEKEATSPEVFFDQKEYDRIYDEKGEHAALAYTFTAYDEAQKVGRQKEESTRLVSEAEQFNQKLGQERAKVLLYENAQKLNDKALLDKYSNDKYQVTAKDFESVPTVLDQLSAEYDFIKETFQREPVKVGGKVVSPQGKWSDDVYKQANILLNHTKIIEQKVRETSDDVIENIKNAKPTAKIITPSGQSKAEINVKFTGNEDEDEVRKKAEQMSDEARLDMLDKM